MDALVLLLALLIPAPVVRDECDLVERNHVLDCEGEVTGSYYVWWDFYCFNGWPDYHTREWRRVDDVGMSPVKVEGGWSLVWTDHKTKTHRQVTARVFIETWGYDREVEDSKRVPEKLRRGFSCAKAPGGFFERTTD